MRRIHRFGSLAVVALVLTMRCAAAADEGARDLRDIRVGMPVADISEAGYVNLTCDGPPNSTLQQWSDWRNCEPDQNALRAIRFGFASEDGRSGTLVAGHPVILTALIDNSGLVAGLKIDTDPDARLYVRKKAFLLAAQFKSRYGSEGWACTRRQPEAGEQPVGGVFLRETCTKSDDGRTLAVQRDLFRREDQDAKNFVNQTQITIMHANSN